MTFRSKLLYSYSGIRPIERNLTVRASNSVSKRHRLTFICSFTQKSYQEPIDKEFQRRYASVVLELERLNRVCCKRTLLKGRCCFYWINSKLYLYTNNNRTFKTNFTVSSRTYLRLSRRKGIEKVRVAFSRFVIASSKNR